MLIWLITKTQLVSISADIHGRKGTSSHCYANDFYVANTTVEKEGSIVDTKWARFEVPEGSAAEDDNGIVKLRNCVD